MSDVSPMQATDDQQPVIAFLSNPQTHGGQPVRRIDTHAAMVFLAGPRALKIKRAVRFPFLDYSTLAKRKNACEREIEINRRFAPQIYRGCTAITRRAGGGLDIAGPGDVVEWAVDMVRFDENLTLDRLAQADSIDRRLAEELADAISQAHDQASVADESSWIESIPLLIEANSTAFAGHFDRQRVMLLDRASHDAFRNVRPALEQRERCGLVRHCHGDLHLANVALIDGKPMPFDAVEFDPEIATTDILYDLAFILMDLCHFGRTEAANIVLNRYLETAALAELEDLSALSLFMSMRAAIRANVLLARRDTDPRAKGAAWDAAHAYFELALHLMAPATPALIAVGGLSGTGKSTLARQLAPLVGPAPGALVLRSDVARKQRFGVPATERLSSAAYRPEVTQDVYRRLMERAERILAENHAVVLDAVCSKEDERTAIAALAARLNVPFHGLFLTADLRTRLQRVGDRAMDASDATSQIVAQQEGYEIGRLDWHAIDASGTPEAALAAARSVIGIE